MKKNLLAVAVVLGLWHTAVLASPSIDELTGKNLPTVDVVSVQPLMSVPSPVSNDSFAMTSQGAYLLASDCFIFINPITGEVVELCPWWS